MKTKKHSLMEKYLLFLVCWLVLAEVSAQLPHDFRSEQIFLGVAKTEWAPNDTIEANGIVTCLAAKNIHPYSRYLYIELLDSSDSVMVRQKVVCDESGRFRARIPTLAVTGKGVYYLRAYTNLMRNFSGENIALQPVLIGKTFPKREKGNSVLRCSIYPEGGFLVENQVQGIVASVTDYAGRAIPGISLSVVDDRSDTLCVGTTRASGFANLKFIPLAARHYKLLVGDGGVTTSYEIPSARGDRMKLQCAINGDKLMFEVLNANSSLSTNMLYFYGKANGLVLIGKGRPSGIVPLGNQSGITTVFLTDSVGNVLSESTLTSKYQMAELPSVPDTIAADSINTWLGHIGSSKGLSVFARFAKKNESWNQFAESELMYKSDYTSPLPFPENFFKESVRDRAADLQSWLSTAKFSRFAIRDAILKDTAMYVYMPEMNMTIHGEVSEAYSNTPGAALVAYNTSNNNVHDTTLDKDGRFRIAVDDFANGTSFFLQALDKYSKPVDSKIILDNDSYPAVSPHERYELWQSEYAETKATVDGMMQGGQLPDVVVKARVKRDEHLSTEKFYSYNYVGRDKIEQYGYLCLVDILRGIPSVRVNYNPENPNNPWQIFSNRGHSSLNSKTEGLVILLDGSRIENDQKADVLQMPADDIETVELLRPWQALAYTWGALDGAIKVTTRGADKSKVRSKGIFYTPLGLSVAKETDETTITPGNYRLLMDVVSPTGITSFEREVMVTE